VIAIAGGLVVGGIAGALLAVPLLAVLNSGIRSLLSVADAGEDPEQVDVLDPQDSAPKDDKSERVKEF
jgi:predicted PurR-regulated permease PerM